MNFKKLFHKHSYKKERLFFGTYEDDGKTWPYTAAAGFVCNCGRKEVEYYSIYEKRCNDIETPTGIQTQAMDWLDNRSKKAEVIQLKIVK